MNELRKRLKMFLSFVLLLAIPLVFFTNQIDAKLNKAADHELYFRFDSTMTSKVNVSDITLSVKNKATNEYQYKTFMYSNNGWISQPVDIENAQDYDYTLYYLADDGQNKLYKVNGTNMNFDGLTLNKGNNYNFLATDVDNGKAYIDLINHSNTFQVSSGSTLFKSNIANSLDYFKLYDENDALIPTIYKSTNGGFVSFKSPSNIGSNTFKYKYEIVENQYSKEASGELTLNSSGYTISNQVGNTATITNSIVKNILFDLEESGNSFNLNDLISISNLEIIPSNNNIKTSINNSISQSGIVNATSKDKNNLVFNNYVAGDSIKINVTKTGFQDVSLVIEFDSDGKIQLKNENDVNKNTAGYSIASNPNIITLKQLIVLEIVQQGNDYIAKLEDNQLNTYLSNIVPGFLKKIPFVVKNNTGKKLYFKDYSFAQNINISNTLRSSSSAIIEYYDKYNPSYPHNPNGDVSFIFDFEAINNISLYDGLLKLYKENYYPNIDKLEDLPAQEISKILSNDWMFNLNTWGGNLNSSYAYPIDTSHAGIKESDPKMIELANSHYYKSLYLSLDETKQNLTGVSSTNEDFLSFDNYINKSNDNVNYVNDALSSLKELDANQEIAFKNSSFVAAGDLINDVYRPSTQSFAFTFELIFSDQAIKQKGYVDVHYVDEKGNKIANSIYLNGFVNDNYKSQQKQISGYKFKAMKKNSAPRNGVFKTNKQTVTYVYSKINNPATEKKPDPKKPISTLKTPQSGDETLLISLIILALGIISSVSLWRRYTKIH